MPSPDSMGDDFTTAVNRVLSNEGGYVFNPNDPGGETIWGITSRTAYKWGFKGEMRYMARETAVDIYRNEYWESPRISDLPFPLAFQVFDGAVNHGPEQSIKWLQRALGTNDDGAIGSITLSLVKARDPLLLGLDYIVRRGKFYVSLPTWPHFGKGWTDKRILDNIVWLRKDCL